MLIRIRNICLLLSFQLISGHIVNALSQPAPTVRQSGCVTDAEDSLPIPGVHVFLSGTTLGSTTDNDGCYSFRAPRTKMVCNLVFSMVGYDVMTIEFIMGLQRDEIINVELHQKIIELEGIEVTTSNMAWQLQLEQFTELIFSATDNSDLCKLVNPEILDFEYDEGHDLFTATGEDPLVIENAALGYMLVLHGTTLSGNEQHLRWGGGIQFVQMESEDAGQHRRWRAARRKAYRGSPRHFLASLASGTYQRERFSICLQNRPHEACMPVSRIELITTNADDSHQFILRFNGTLQIVYHREDSPRNYRGRTSPSQESWITLFGGQLAFDRDGHELTPWALEKHGYWAWERLAEALPYDYVPE